MNEVINYIMDTPGNTNPNVLRGMLEKSSGDDRFIVKLTPTVDNFSGVMDKTVAEIDAAYNAGKPVFFRVYVDSDYIEANVTSGYASGTQYPSFNCFFITNTPYDAIVYLWTGTGASGDKRTYNATLYPLTTGE